MFMGCDLRKTLYRREAKVGKAECGGRDLGPTRRLRGINVRRDQGAVGRSIS
jgi:hypothetical protein